MPRDTRGQDAHTCVGIHRDVSHGTAYVYNVHRKGICVPKEWVCGSPWALVPSPGSPRVPLTMIDASMTGKMNRWTSTSVSHLVAIGLCSPKKNGLTPVQCEKWPVDSDSSQDHLSRFVQNKTFSRIIRIAVNEQA